MKLILVAATACVAAGLGLAAPASALPIAPGAPGLIQEGGLVIQVDGCHREVRRHFVPEVGRRIPHFHRGRNCRPILVEDNDDDDDFDRRRPRRRDCHRDVQRHYLPEFGGSVVHRHSPGSCRPIPLRRSGRDRPRDGFCVDIGPIRYCE